MASKQELKQVVDQKIKERLSKASKSEKKEASVTSTGPSMESGSSNVSITEE